MTDHLQTVYGDQIVSAEIGDLGEYVAVVDPIPWRMCHPKVPRPPRQVISPRSLERSYLDALAVDLSMCDAVVAIGGGMVADAGKYLAFAAGLPLMIVPSITSNNAPFSDSISVRTDGEPVGMVAAGQRKRVVVDFELIQRADPRLNRAGFADLLAHDVALRDCHLAAERGHVPINEETRREVAAAMANCRAAAAQVGAVTREGIEFVMRTFERLTRLVQAPGAAPLTAGSEHLVAWNLEAVTGRHFIHGELVALGIVVAAIAHHDDGSLQGALDQARVHYRLAELELSWLELKQALLSVNDYNRRVRNFETVFTDLTWTDDLLAQVYAALT